jgi:Protein of unknown function (DUF3151)
MAGDQPVQRGGLSHADGVRLGAGRQDGAMTHENLLARPTPPPTYLPENTEAATALRDGADPSSVAARFPSYCAAWADLAERVLDDDPVTAYAYARTGYHRGLDQLRRAGWHGYGPVPWEHEPNRGFLRSLHALGAAAAAIGEDDEAARVSEFLADASPAAIAALG